MLQRLVTIAQPCRGRLHAAWLLAAVLAVLGACVPAAADTDGGLRTVSAQGVIVGGARIEKSAQFAVPLCPGSNINYGIRLTNTGSQAAAASILDPIPAGVTYIPGSVAGGAVFEAANNRIVWNGVLAPGQTASIGFSVTVDLGVPSGSVILNRADGLMGELLVQVDLPVTVDCPQPIPIEVEKTSSFDAPLCPGSRIDYAVTLRNLSGRERALDAMIEDAIPVNTSFVPGSITGDALIIPFAPPGRPHVVWNGELGPGQSKTIGFAVRLDEGLPNGAVIGNQALGRLADPLLGDSAEKQAERSDTVNCVKKVVEAKPKIRQKLWLRAVAVIDDMDPSFFRGCGDLYFASWINDENDPASAAQTRPKGDEKQKELNICDGTQEGFVPPALLYEKEVCCELREIAGEVECVAPQLEAAIDFWDDDDDTFGKILTIGKTLADIFDLSQGTQQALRGAEAIAKALELAGNPSRDSLGTFDDPDLTQPPVPPAEPPQSSCVLDDAVETTHDILLSGGTGKKNGEITLRWKAKRLVGEDCSVIVDPPAESGLGSLRATPQGSDELRIETELVQLELRGQGPIEVRTRVDPVVPSEGPEPARSEAVALSGPGRAVAAVTALGAARRVDVRLSEGMDGVLIETLILVWGGSGWLPIAASPREVSFVEGHLTVVVGHQDLGGLPELSVSAELLRDGMLLDRLPRDPGDLHPLAWGSDTTPPEVSFVQLVPAAAGGSVAEIVAGFSERVVATLADVVIDPPVAFDVEPAERGRELRILPFDELAPGTYTLTLRASITDVAGNPLDGDGDDVGGDPHTVSFTVPGRGLFASDAAGEPRNEFSIEEEIYAAGEGFDSGAAFDLYLLDREAVAEGARLADQTTGGPTAAAATAGGTLAPTSVGRAVRPGELSLVADLDRNGRFAAAADRLWRQPGIGVNVVPGGCLPGPATLCLGGGRFRVEVAWETRQGTRGAGQAERLTEDTGYFWFFDRDNVEMVVKVLDACNGFDRFWVFAGGLTNVQVQTTVTDTATGESKIYRNPQRTPFQPLQDTDAFATCDAGSGVRSGAGASDLAPARAPAGRPGTLPAWAEEALAPRGLPQAETALFLGDGGRFKVEVAWETRQGTRGVGQPVTLTDDTGYFWFFERDNVEMVIKVLDACNGFDRFWVFAGGLTNVEVEITVTDTATDESKTYRNPQRTPFQPVQDTDAFTTCP